MEPLSCVLCFCPPGPRDSGMHPQRGTRPPGQGAYTVALAGSPSFPTAGCLPPTHRPPAGADSERKQKLHGVLGGGGEAKQNQAGYFKPDLNSPLSLLSPALATPPTLGSSPSQEFPRGEGSTFGPPPPPPFPIKGQPRGSCSQAGGWDRGQRG